MLSNGGEDDGDLFTLSARRRASGLGGQGGVWPPVAEPFEEPRRHLQHNDEEDEEAEHRRHADHHEVDSFE